jgi:hypothetical protein
MADRTESFSVVDEHLIRSVIPARGKPYEHRCPRSSFEEVAYAIDELNREGRTFTLEELVEITDLPSSQIAVALAFMKERGCVVTQWRRNSGACSCLFEDAMTEYWALAEKGP